MYLACQVYAARQLNHWEGELTLSPPRVSLVEAKRWSRGVLGTAIWRARREKTSLGNKIQEMVREGMQRGEYEEFMGERRSTQSPIRQKNRETRTCAPYNK